MKAMQKKMNAAAGPRTPINDLDPVGFTVQPMQFIFACAAFIISVILLHFFLKLSGGH